MLNGFFEIGLFSLVAFGFVNVIWGITMVMDTPPLQTSNWKELERGIATEGAALITPVPAEKVHVS
ncbi:MAG: hypothetical protein HY282_05665 [Nitrospirae bacterium]|nr:hypothetical protein [Candidatus Manganitrophaceae bacterium]